MTPPDTENGFGSGLRAQLRLKQGDAEQTSEIVAPPAEQEFEPEPVAYGPAPAEAEAEVDALRGKLEEALDRERELREALQHHVEAHERELAAGRDRALQEAEVQQDSARLAEREVDLDAREQAVRELHELVAEERRELNQRRTELLGEEARIVEMGLHVDARAANHEGTSVEHEKMGAELARQLAVQAERERELNGAKAELAARESASRVREEAAGARERDLVAAEAELQRERARLQERVEAIAARETDTDGRLAAREAAVTQSEEMLADRQASLSAWEERVSAQAERLERERTGHGRASQEAFTLLAELEQRDEAIRMREETLKLRELDLAKRPALKEAESPQIVAREQLLSRGESHLTSLREDLDRREEIAAHTAHELSEREEAVARLEHELRLRDAKLGADLELREEKLEQLAEELADQERRLSEREEELTVYVGELQQQIA